VLPQGQQAAFDKAQQSGADHHHQQDDQRLEYGRDNGQGVRFQSHHGCSPGRSGSPGGAWSPSVIGSPSDSSVQSAPAKGGTPGRPTGTPTAWSGRLSRASAGNCTSWS